MILPENKRRTLRSPSVFGLRLSVTSCHLSLTAYDHFVLPSSAHRESANADVTSADIYFYDPASLDTSKPAEPALGRNSESHAACLADAAAVLTASHTGMLAQSSTLFIPELRIPPQVPNAGRGLAPVEPVKQGTIIHSEKPMLCFPAFKHAAKVCHHCLTPLQSRQPSVSAVQFCSKPCETASFAYSGTEKSLDLSPLSEYCMEYEERFPLLLARAACMHLSKQPMERHLSSSPAAKQQGSHAPQGDIWQDYMFLTFARVPPPPPSPWIETHALLQKAVQDFVREQQATVPANVHHSLIAAAADLSLEWYVGMLARLHINSFRVDGVMLTGDCSLAEMAAASVGAQQGGSLGTAVYLLASLFNHSCDPNVDVTYPMNNSTAHFVAARDIAAGEQLCISYIDASMNVNARQQQLDWGYGFRCTCVNCTEDATQQS